MQSTTPRSLDGAELSWTQWRLSLRSFNISVHVVGPRLEPRIRKTILFSVGVKSTLVQGSWMESAGENARNKSFYQMVIVFTVHCQAGNGILAIILRRGGKVQAVHMKTMCVLYGGMCTMIESCGKHANAIINFLL